VAGLAAITPASGYVPTWAALVIGGAAGLLCYGAVLLKSRMRYDDALDVVGVHLVGGFIGVVLTGVFASLAVNALGTSSADGCNSAASRYWPWPDSYSPLS
jgi:Amt family ammonium transporter